MTLFELHQPANIYRYKRRNSNQTNVPHTSSKRANEKKMSAPNQRKRKLITTREKKEKSRKRVCYELSSDEDDESQQQNKENVPSISNEPCAICYEMITFRGKIDSCDHMFCFGCVQKWAKDSTLCPICRARFFAITKECLTAGNSDLQSSAPVKKCLEKIRIPLKDFSHQKYVDDEEYYGTIARLVSDEAEEAGRGSDASDDDENGDRADEDEYGNLAGFVVGDNDVEYEPGFSQEEARIRTPAAERVRRRPRNRARPFRIDVEAEWSDGEQRRQSVISIHSTPSPPKKLPSPQDNGYDSDPTIEIDQKEIDKIVQSMFSIM